VNIAIGKRMRVISKRTLREFWETHADAERPLKHWYDVTRRAVWTNISEVRDTFTHADQVGLCTVFNIHGNDYRLIAKIKYDYGIVYIRFVLTHREYDRDAWKNDC
jgi:mRNA interferase HigB